MFGCELELVPTGPLVQGDNNFSSLLWETTPLGTSVKDVTVKVSKMVFCAASYCAYATGNLVVSAVLFYAFLGHVSFPPVAEPLGGFVDCSTCQASLQPVDFSPEIFNNVCLVDLKAVLVVGVILALGLQASAATGPARLRSVTLRRPGQPLHRWTMACNSRLTLTFRSLHLMQDCCGRYLALVESDVVALLDSISEAG